MEKRQKKIFMKKTLYNIVLLLLSVFVVDHMEKILLRNNT